MRHLDPGRSDFLGRHVKSEKLETASSRPFPDHTVEHHLQPQVGGGQRDFIALYYCCFPEHVFLSPQPKRPWDIKAGRGQHPLSPPLHSPNPPSPPLHELRPGFPTVSRSGSHRRLCPHPDVPEPRTSAPAERRTVRAPPSGTSGSQRPSGHRGEPGICPAAQPPSGEGPAPPYLPSPPLQDPAVSSTQNPKVRGRGGLSPLFPF